MKKLLLYTTAMLALTFGSCQQESDPVIKVGNNSFTLQVELDNIGTGMQTDTRAIIVDPLDGEEKVAGLHLLFFESSSDASGKFTHHIQVNSGNEITTGTNLSVNFEGANSGSYSILGLANVDSYFVDSQTGSLSDFLGGLTTNMSEADVLNSTMLYAGGSIAKDKLVMSGRTEKIQGEQLVTLKLTRGVCRYDVQNLDSEYNLVSVAIYNNTDYTPLWLSTVNASVKPTVNDSKFYGVTITAGSSQEIKGGLYSFENYVASPVTGDKATTCLVIGLEPKAGGAVQYYRVNINPEESGQSIKRNYVYQVSVRNILGDGATSDDLAYASTTDPNLDYDINNWNLDDEGMILTDGKNTLAIPSKIIRFTQEGGTRQYTIFTQGEGSLAMTQSLPNGFTASLSGNNLTVKANDLGNLKSREGTLDLSFAGLKGTVQVIQEPKESHFLRLDKSALSGFPATKGSDSYDQAITVNSSKNWNAKIYNTGGSLFSFNASASVLEVSDKSSGESINLYISGDNPTNKVLTGFVLFSLKDEPGYSRVVMLKQAPSSGISIDLGTLTALNFKVNGAPKTIANSTPGDAYEFLVDPGTDLSGDYNDWGAELTGTNAAKFKAVVEKYGDIQRVSVYPLGDTDAGIPSTTLPHYNLTSNTITGVELKVYWGSSLSAVEGDNTKCKVVSVAQDALQFNVITGADAPKTGGERIIEIDLSEGLTWKATIVGNQAYDPSKASTYGNMEHKGYLVNGSQKVSDINGSVGNQSGDMLKFGFGKLLFPLVNITPELKVEISVEQIASVTPKTVTLKQEKLLPQTVNVLDVYGGDNDYGSYYNGSYMTATRGFYGNTFGTSNGSNIRCYAAFVKSPATASVVDRFNASTSTPATISNQTYNYLNYGYTKETLTTQGFDELNRWRTSDAENGMIFITQDVSSTYGSNRGRPFFNEFAKIGYVEATISSNSDAVPFLNTNGDRVLTYLHTAGPFGETNITQSYRFDGIDGAHTAITKTSILQNGGTPIIHEYNNEENVILFIDAQQRVAFNGEVVMLYNSAVRYDNIESSTAANRAKSRLVGNFHSFLVRAAQYGSHFTDLFKKGSDGNYLYSDPFSVSGVTKEPMFE